MSESLDIARGFLAKEVEVIIDRPLGSKHPKHDFVYGLNYGYIDKVLAPDGEYLDAYYIGEEKPLEKARGFVRAIVHRLEDDDDKLVVVSEDNIDISIEDIERAVYFQERWFKHRVVFK